MLKENDPTIDHSNWVVAIEYQAMIDEIEADMAAQLERVRQMERRGELIFAAEATAPRDHGR